jgi:ABC-type transport system involved in cytochrome c biogenesis permease subunit
MNAIARLAPWLAALVGIAYLGAGAYPRQTPADRPDLRAIGAMPVQDGGRLKPLDTFAQTTLTAIGSRQNFVKDPKEAGEKSYPPIEWLLEVWGQEPFTGKAADYPVFRITDLQLVDYFGLKQRPGFWRYSPNDVRSGFDKLARDIDRLTEQRKKDPNSLTPFDNNLLELGRHVNLYLRLANRQEPRVVPPQADDQDWQAVAEIERELVRPQAREVEEWAVNAAISELAPNVADPKDLTPEQKKAVNARAEERFREQMIYRGKWERRRLHPAAEAFVQLCDKYRDGSAEDFNTAVTAYRDTYLAHVPQADLTRVRVEAIYNRLSPFYNCMILYVLVFVMACGSWILTALRWDGGAASLRRSALALATVTVVVHFASLLCRMYLMNRWLVFVTNLYSSAIFIGWACVCLGLLVELLFGRGLGTAVASVIGASTLVIAYFLGLDGDTLNMLQAVLDTNFWLATHVTTVTLGYSATYFAGIFGLVYILTGVATPFLTGEVRKSLGQVIYGVVSFATLLSFTGTVLGGIWADQSWGRFWGWDPKENGALLIVIWNALILHARWGGLVKQRGVAVLAVFGCVVTTWSWFGTNQLGVGLHSYGFTTGRTIAIICASTGFTLLACVGMIPTRFWTSTRAELAARSQPKGRPTVQPA